MGFRRLWTIGLLGLTIGMLGCGRENKLYPNANDPRQSFGIGAEGPPGQTGQDGRDYLPAGFFDHSVNQASVDLALDGSTAESVALRLRTQPIDNDPGAYNGTGDGNKAILGLSQYDNTSLQSFDSISFESKVFAGSQQLYVNLIVDLYCDGSNLKIVVADFTSLGSSTPLSYGYSGWYAAASQAKWRAVGGIQDPAIPANTILPSHLALGSGKLSDVAAAYPFACLVNAETGDGGMPKGQPTSAVMLILGDSTTKSFNGAFVRQITVNADTYSEFK